MSELPKVTTIADVIRTRAAAHGDDPVFTFEGDVMTYAALDAESSRAANAMRAAGVGKGDRVAYLGKNSHWYFEMLLGAAKIGAVMTPVNWRLAPPEVAYVANDCGAKLLFVGPEFAELIAAIRDDLPQVELVYGAEGPVGGFPGYADWRDGFPADDPGADVAPTDDALQLYTSGTTGHPKGAVLTGQSIFGERARLSDADLADWQRAEPGEAMLLAMPCFHIGGTGSGLGNMYNAGHAVVVREYDPTEALDFIEQYRIGKIFMVPAAIQILLNHPRIGEVDFSHLKYITYGASPIPLSMMQESIERFGCGFVQMYGMTETSGTIVALPPEDHDPDGNPKMRSVGKPLQGVEVKVIDDDGNEVATREVGEIATRSLFNMKGYWNLDEATAATIDGDGWLRTGDAGYFDEDGYLYIHDRVKDMIISGGENIYPAEVENAIYGHPAVADVAVIGVPDEKWGEAVKACVVTKEGEALSEADVIAFARQNIAGFKCPKSVDFIDALPRNPSGKILRRELRAPYWEGKDRAVN